MYKSPIEIIVNEIQTQIVVDQENGIYKAISSYGINVDKEELIKALTYDRQQYQKGYKDGICAFMEKFLETADRRQTGTLSFGWLIEQIDLENILKDMIGDI